MLTSFRKSAPLLLLMTFIAGVNARHPLTLHYNPPYICALKGSSVKMSCFSADGDDMKVIWTKGSSPDLCSDSVKRGRVQCEEHKEIYYSITLTGVTEADKDIYYCKQKRVKRPTKENLGVQLDVTDLQVETKQRVQEGDTVTLTCKTICALPEETTFIWYKNRERLTEPTLNQLPFESVSRFDAGFYQCTVRGGEHLISPGVFLNVEYPPPTVSLSISPSGEIVEGDSVTLNCSGDSNPPQDFQWFKEEMYLGFGETYSISSISSDNSGEYKCRARNRQGMKYSDPVVLNVMYAPRDVVVTVNSSDATVTLSCSSDSNPPAELSWFKEDQSSAVGSGQSFSALKSGQYYCEAYNPHGSQRSGSVSVTVKESSLSLITVGITVAAVLTSVIIMISFWLFIRCNEKVESPEDNYMTLDPKTRCSEYDTLDRLHENAPSPEDQEAVYYNTASL